MPKSANSIGAEPTSSISSPARCDRRRTWIGCVSPCRVSRPRAVVRSRESATGSVSSNSALGNWAVSMPAVAQGVVAPAVVGGERGELGLQLRGDDLVALELGGAADVGRAADRVLDPEAGELLAHAVADERVAAAS